MVIQTLPCAEKNCRGKMALTENTDDILYYGCLENHNEHIFRYNMVQKKWLKIIIKTKLIFSYNKNPCEEPLIKTSNVVGESQKKLDQAQVTHDISNLTEIKGVGSKRAKELERAGVKTTSDLAKRSPKHLSEKTGIPITQISKWIIEANNIIKSPINIPA